jgi:hypothetical protein
MAGKAAWDAVPFVEKVAIWHRAAGLFSGAWRYKIMAATMLGQGKNAWQAEIDAGAEVRQGKTALWLMYSYPTFSGLARRSYQSCINSSRL